MKVCTRMIALALFGLCCLSGCAHSHRLPQDDQLPNNTVPTKADSSYVLLHADWPYYNTAEALIDAADNIYTGKVIDITFDIIDEVTGESDQSNLSESKDRMLYTVYIIEVSESYKGKNDGTKKLCIMGGILGFDENSQYSLMQKSGLITEYSGLPIDPEIGKKLIVGESYLFCGCESRTGNHDYIVNPVQYAFYVDSESAALIQEQCNNELTKNAEDQS